MGSPRATTAAGRGLIKSFEGFSPAVYVCPAGYPTIGYGHVVQPDEAFPEPMSIADADLLLQRDLPRYENAVCRLIEVPLADPCFDALVSFTFNLGEGALQASTLRRLANAGRLADAAPQFDRWVFAGAQKLPGLVRRRAAERALWESGL
jgi:lysozyme